MATGKSSASLTLIFFTPSGNTISFKMLRENVKSQEMEETIDRCWTEYPNGLVAYIEKGDVPKGGKGLARYLAKYVVSPPISLKENHKI